MRVFFLSTGSGPVRADLPRGWRVTALVTPISRVVLEKPLGYDRASSAEINERVGKLFTEPQIFRIDHYLGKETVQNLLALRFGNSCSSRCGAAAASSTCRSPSPRRVGVERRAEFYDQIGALRDMVQNHLLQLLCIIAMEPPATATRTPCATRS